MQGYRDGRSIAAISASVGRAQHGVAARLTELFRRESAVRVDDDTLATRHCFAYAQEQRKRPVAASTKGQTIERIANDLGRSPLAVTW